MNQEKTPVSILQEMMQQQNVIPHYQLLSEHGSHTHKPTFVIRVNANGMTGIGKGNSKKTAKQEAARNFLYKMGLEKVIKFDQNNQINNTESPIRPRDINEEFTIPSTIEQNFEVSSMDVNLRKKAVAILKYYTMQLNLPSPQFEEISACGPPHLRVFTYKCSIGSYDKQASGQTKIEARDTSALLMLEALKKNHFENSKIDQKSSSSASIEAPSGKTEVPSVKTETPSVKTETPSVKTETPSVKTETPSVTEEADNYSEISDTKIVIDNIRVAENQSTSTSCLNDGFCNTRSTNHFYIIKNYVLAKNITYEDLWKDNVEYDFKTLDTVLTMLGIKYDLSFMRQDMKFIAFLLIDIVPAFYIIEIGATVKEATKSVAKHLLVVLKVVTK